MSIPEIPGTKETVDALKGTPMLLVLLIIIAAVLGMITFLDLRQIATNASGEKRTDRTVERLHGR